MKTFRTACDPWGVTVERVEVRRLNFWFLAAKRSLTPALFFCLSVCLSVCLSQTWIHPVWSAYDNLWQLMTTYDNLWQLMTTYDSLWQLMIAYDSL